MPIWPYLQEKQEKISFFLILYFIVISLVIIVPTKYLVDKRVSQEKQENAQIIFNIISNEFDQIISDSEDDLTEWALEIDIDDYESGCQTDYTNVLESNEAILNYRVIDKLGYSICSRLPLDEDFNFNEEVLEYSQFVVDEKFSITNFGYSESTGLPRIGFSYPLFDSNGNLNGGIYTSLSLININKQIEELGLPENSELLITDPYGAIQIVYPYDVSMLGEHKFSSTIFSLILANKEGQLIQKDDSGTNMIYIYKPYYYAGSEILSSFIIYGVEYPSFLFWNF